MMRVATLCGFRPWSRHFCLGASTQRSVRFFPGFPFPSSHLCERHRGPEERAVLDS